MLTREVPGGAARFVIEDQIDLTLTPQLHVLAAVAGDVGEAHGLEDRFDHALLGSTKLDEFETVEPDRILEKIAHIGPLALLVTLETKYALCTPWSSHLRARIGSFGGQTDAKRRSGVVTRLEV